jgi:photosystem II stability/assembly factor-like uncharacterized protein
MELLQPEMGEISNIVKGDNGYLYTWSENGWFVSADQGNTWVKAKRGADWRMSQSFTKCNNKLWAQHQGFFGGSVYMLFSEDEGYSWEMIETSPRPPHAFLLWNKSEKEIRLFNYDEWVQDLNDHFSIFSSSDGGLNWIEKQFPFVPSGNITLHSCEMAEDSLIVAYGYYEYGPKNDIIGFVLYSDNYGETWRRLDFPHSIKSVEIINRDTILFGANPGLYISHDGCESYSTLINDYIFRDICFLGGSSFICKINNESIFSNDFFKTWVERLGNPPLFSSTIFFFDMGISKLYAGSGLPFGFFISQDSGKTWRRSVKGFSAANIIEIAEDTKGNIYATSNQSGLYKSTDDGLTWPLIGLGNHKLENIAIDRSDRIYVNVYYGDTAVIFRSIDEGLTWENKSNGISWPSGIKVLVSDIFILRDGRILLGSEFGNYWESSDYGENWSKVKTDGGAYAFAYNSEGHLFKCGNFGSICRSTDEGYTWEEMPIIKPNPIGPQDLFQIVFSPYSQIGYISNTSPTMSHVNWADCNKTTDNGRTWNYIDEIGHFAIDSLKQFWRSIYTSYDNGVNWLLMNDGLNLSGLNDIFVSSKGYIYLAAHNGGLYRSRQAFVSAPDTPPAEHSGITISPNPASDYIDINLGRWTPSVRWSPSDLKLYNSLGECVLSPLAFGEGPGVRLDISALPPGLYFISINNGDEILTGSFIVMR